MKPKADPVVLSDPSVLDGFVFLSAPGVEVTSSTVFLGGKSYPVESLIGSSVAIPNHRWPNAFVFAGVSLLFFGVGIFPLAAGLAWRQLNKGEVLLEVEGVGQVVAFRTSDTELLRRIDDALSATIWFDVALRATHRRR